MKINFKKKELKYENDASLTRESQQRQKLYLKKKEIDFSR